MADLDKFFKAKSIVLVGVSKDPNKLGHVVFRNFIDGDYKGELFLVNPNANRILGKRCYSNILAIKEKIDVAVIVIPAKLVIGIVKQCKKKGIKHVIIISAGFKEVGNTKLEEDLKNYLNENKMTCIGVNGLGIFDAYTDLDTLFLPRLRLKRPSQGGISFISQSGAVGSTVLDLASKNKYGFAKFISYGNATNIDEADLIEYLGKDKQTKVICMYIEAVMDGKKFIEVAKKISKIKPIIALKSGTSEEGHKATISHTGSLAGDEKIYDGAFKQAGVIHAHSLEEVFDYARILEKVIKPKGDRVQIITNGGGYGIIATDALLANELTLAELSEKSKKYLKEELPSSVLIRNPLDLIGDATTSRYNLALQSCVDDKNIDIIYIILLFQTPLITIDVVDVITESNDLKKKPIVVVSTGGEFTEVLKNSLEDNGVTTFTFPENAAKSVKTLVEYYKIKK